MVWTDSQDYGADEILYTARTVLFDKTNRLIREIIILFEVSPVVLPSPLGIAPGGRFFFLSVDQTGR